MLKLIFRKKIDEQVKVNFKNAYTQWVQTTDPDREIHYMAEMKKIAEKSGYDFTKLKPEKVKVVTLEQKRKQKDFKKIFTMKSGSTIEEQMKNENSSYVTLAMSN